MRVAMKKKKKISKKEETIIWGIIKKIVILIMKLRVYLTLKVKNTEENNYENSINKSDKVI